MLKPGIKENQWLGPDLFYSRARASGEPGLRRDGGVAHGRRAQIFGAIRGVPTL
jgi:hypothetical protein